MIDAIAALFESLSIPVDVIVGILTILAAVLVLTSKTRNQLDKYVKWWKGRFNRASQKGSVLLQDVENNFGGYSDKKRLSLLLKAYKHFKKANAVELQGHAMYQIAKAKSAVLSDIRNDKEALISALKAASLFESTQKHGWTAEAYLIAGDLCLVPNSQRDEGKAKKYYSLAKKNYQFADMPLSAENLDARFKIIMKTFGDK